MNTIPEFLEKTFEDDPNKIAVISEKQQYSYNEIDQMSSSVAQNLSNYPKNSVVSMMLENSIEFIITYLGILRSAKIAHIIPANISKINLNEQIISANPKCVISSNQYFSKFEEQKLNLDVLDAEKISIDGKSDYSKNEIKKNDYAYLVYTSGTTGKPKGIAVTHENVLFSTKNIVDVLQYKKSDREILPLPLSHSFGLGCLHTGLFVGSTIILHKNSTNVENILKSISENQATTLASVPATLSKMVENFHDKTKNSCENLRLIITNSTAISETTVKKIIGILKTGKISTYYGLTEASRSSFMIFDGEVSKYNSVGHPAPNVQIKIEGDDLDGNGEICIKGQNVINNYWKNKEMDGNIENGWLRTSDIGHFDKDGFLYLDGRIDDMINVSGEKVNPSEIEMIVNEIGGIEESIAIGIPHETFGQVVKLFAKKTNESKIQESEVIAYCIKRLERYKVPVNIRFIDEFPRTEYGKIKRYELKDLG